MSTIKTTNIQHPDADGPAIVLNAEGTVELPLSNLEDLANVNVVSPLDGQALVFEDGEWVADDVVPTSLDASVITSGTLDAARLPAGFLYAGTAYFTSNGTFSKTNPLATGDIGLRAIKVRCQGGGGGGAGAGTTDSFNSSIGNGGGGGGYAESFITDIAGLSDTVTVTRGAGGTAGTGNGGAGGASSFGTLVVGNGGGGGGTLTINGSRLMPGVGGGGGTGQLVIAGKNSVPRGIVLANTTDADRALSGGGGDSHLGAGALPRSGTGQNGVAGTIYGGGGSGGKNAASQGTARSGGAGAAGIVIVDCYV
jgi:hypothetical protein